MRTVEPSWDSPQVSRLASAHDLGGLIRLGRDRLGWRQVDLGRRIGCSASTVSRLERRGSHADLLLLKQAASEVGMPINVLAESLGLTQPATTTVTAVGPRVEEDPMRRRTLLAAAGLAAPVGLLAGMDTALANMPDPTGSPVPLDQRLAAARSAFDAGRNKQLLHTLPGLIGDGHDGACRTRTDLAYARLSSTYSLASQVLVKVGRYDQARLTADRATPPRRSAPAPRTRRGGPPRRRAPPGLPPGRERRMAAQPGHEDGSVRPTRDQVDQTTLPLCTMTTLASARKTSLAPL